MPKAQITIVRKIVPDENERGYVGVRAVAKIKVPYGYDWITTTIESPGLWGIDDEHDEEYLQAVFEEGKQTLLGMLTNLRDFELVE